MVVADLTPENFIQKIKRMDRAERNRLKAKELIDLIVEAPLFTYDDNATIQNIRTQLAMVVADCKSNKELAQKNQEEIVALKASNARLEMNNTDLQGEIDTLKQRNVEDGGVGINQLRILESKIQDFDSELNEIQQYLRVNNIEIVGLLEVNEGETEEKLILNALNELRDLTDVIRPEDIDICHPLNSNRSDNKNVHTVKFVSRKVKFDILKAKRGVSNKNFKFRNNDIFINEHLSPTNRSLFAGANGKKRELGYRFCWTKGGKILMRKTEDSEVIPIKCQKDLDTLV